MTGQPEKAGEAPLVKRLLWFVGLWAASVAALSIVACAIRAVLLG